MRGKRRHIDYRRIASSYDIDVHKVERGDELWESEGEEIHLNRSFSAGRDQIVIGVYDDKDAEIASFFHELGHCISPNLREYDPKNLKFHYELDAWMVGLTEAYKWGYMIKPSTFKFMVECIDSYIGWEEREIRNYEIELPTGD
jgi:hypothetical protein